MLQEWILWFSPNLWPRIVGLKIHFTYPLTFFVVFAEEPFYRPDDDSVNRTVNAFQELHLPTDINDIFFVGERGIASAVSLSDITDRRVSRLHKDQGY